MRQVIKDIIKVRIIVVGLLIFCTFQLIGCTASNLEKHPDTVQVKLPWYSLSGYRQQIIDLISITDIVNLKGWAARFLLSPGVDSSGQLYGLEPSIHTFSTSDGVVVPTDYLSAELLTLYAHFEKLAQLDLEIGADQVIQNWPRVRTVAVSVNMTNDDGKKELDNVRYSGAMDAFLFVPYTDVDLPFSINAGVIGHEHFHSLFYQLVIKPSLAKHPELDQPSMHKIPDFMRGRGGLTYMDERSSYHKFLLRALNEGLADVWGWIYSGDPCFVERSIPNKQDRDLSLSANALYSQYFIAENSLGNEDSDLVYLMGTSYARRIYTAMQKNGGDRIKLAKALLRSLIRIQNEFINLDDTAYFDPKRPLEIIQSEYPDLNIEIEN